MARTRCQFTQEAMTRLLRASSAAGVPVRIEIEKDGKIVVIPAAGAQVAEPEPPKRGGEIVL